MTTKRDMAAALVHQIRENVDRWYAGKISDEAFRSRNRALYDEIDAAGLTEHVRDLTKPEPLVVMR